MHIKHCLRESSTNIEKSYPQLSYKTARYLDSELERERIFLGCLEAEVLVSQALLVFSLLQHLHLLPSVNKVVAVTRAYTSTINREALGRETIIMATYTRKLATRSKSERLYLFLKDRLYRQWSQRLTFVLHWYCGWCLIFLVGDVAEGDSRNCGHHDCCLVGGEQRQTEWNGPVGWGCLTSWLKLKKRLGLW